MSILSALFVFFTASAAFLQGPWRSDREPAQVNEAYSAHVTFESQFYEALELEALRSYDKYAAQLPGGVDRRLWAELTRASLRVFWTAWEYKGHALALAKKAGPFVVVVEILTTAVFPPLFVVLKAPMLAAISVAGPWGIVTGAGHQVVTTFWERRKLMRTLGVDSLSNLEQDRAEALGYRTKTRLLSVQLEALEDTLEREAPVEIVTSLRRAGDARGLIPLKELEDIVASAGNEGADFLTLASPHKAKKTAYASILLRYVFERPELAQRFRERALAGLDEVSKDQLRNRALFARLGNLRQELKWLRTKFPAKVDAASLASLPSNGYEENSKFFRIVIHKILSTLDRDSEAAEFKAFMGRKLHEVSDIEKALTETEFVFLKSLRDGEQATGGRAPLETLLSEVEAYVSHLKAVGEKLEAMADGRLPAHWKLIEELERAPELSAHPLEAAKRSFDCRGALVRLLR